MDKKQAHSKQGATKETDGEPWWRVRGAGRGVVTGLDCSGSLCEEMMVKLRRTDEKDPATGRP